MSSCEKDKLRFFTDFSPGVTIRGLPFMTSAKFPDFLTPPPCNVKKSADFVPFICFLVTPLPLLVRTSYTETPLTNKQISFPY